MVCEAHGEAREARKTGVAERLLFSLLREQEVPPSASVTSAAACREQEVPGLDGGVCLPTAFLCNILLLLFCDIA